jgi:hypothetical protein
MPVSDKVPLALRTVTIVLAILAFATGGAGHLKSCRMGTTGYNSYHQVNFIIALGVIVCVVMTLRVVAFDYKRRRLPGMHVQVAFDALFLVLTFIAAVAAAISPIANDVCAGESEMRVFIEEVCEFSCSNVVASIVMTFFMFLCFLAQLLFTTGIIRVGGSATPPEDFTFDETTGTPRAHKASANQSPAHAAVGEV